MDEEGFNALIKKLANALIGVIDARLTRRGDMVLTDASLKSLVHELRDPEVAKAFERPPSPPQLPIEPEYPRLRVRYDHETGRALEYAVIEDVRSEIPFMRGWYRRPMGELSQLQQEQVRRAE
jgi:hypothetical protein